MTFLPAFSITPNSTYLANDGDAPLHEYGYEYLQINVFYHNNACHILKYSTSPRKPFYLKILKSYVFSDPSESIELINPNLEINYFTSALASLIKCILNAFHELSPLFFYQLDYLLFLRIYVMLLILLHYFTTEFYFNIECILRFALFILNYYKEVFQRTNSLALYRLKINVGRWNKSMEEILLLVCALFGCAQEQPEWASLVSKQQSGFRACFIRVVREISENIYSAKWPQGTVDSYHLSGYILSFTCFIACYFTCYICWCCTCFIIYILLPVTSLQVCYISFVFYVLALVLNNRYILSLMFSHDGECKRKEDRKK